MNVIGVKINGKDIENPDPERNLEGTDTLLVIMKKSDVSNVI